MRRKQTKNRRERVQYCTCVCNQESIHDSKLYLPLSIYNYSFTVNLNKSHDINAKNQNIGESQTACYLQYLEQTINILYYEHRWNL